MVEREMDIDYLNRFLNHLWPAMADILQSEVTHRAFKEIQSQPVRISRRRTRLDLSGSPEAFALGQDRLELRIPSGGTNKFSTRIYLLPWLPFPRISTEVYLRVSVTITPDADPDTRIEAVVNSNLVGTLVDRWSNWKNKLRDSFSGEELEREIGYFAAARYAPSAVPEIPKPERVYPDRPLLDCGINIVLVPESFSQSDLGRFDQMVDAVVNTLSLPDDTHANDPFYSLKTAMHVWTIKPEQSPEGDHVMGSFVDPRGHRRVALANLARLAAIGRAAERTGSGVTILVFVVNPDAPRFGGRRPTAMSLGNVIMQPLQETPKEDAYLLLHELGHTGLGNLGDEYVLRSRQEERYLGQPPDRPNLTADRSLHKWARWMQAPSHLPAWDEQAIVGAEGAGYFGSGIWRPAEKCAMRHSKEGVPFCAVCRETLTNGIREALGGDQILLRVEYPSGESAFLRVVAGGSDVTPQEILLPDDPALPISVTPVAGTLPEPWQITAEFAGEGSFQEHVEGQPEAGLPVPSYRYTFSAADGDRIKIQIHSKCPFTPWDPIPSQDIELQFISR